MNAEMFAEWLKAQGHKVTKTESSDWVEAGPHIWQAFPYHRVITPTETELNQLFFKHAALGLRYSTPWQAGEGAASYHVVYDQPEYPLAALPKKARYDVRKGSQAAQIEQIAFERLATEGWQLRRDTLQRQGRVGAEDERTWQRLCLSASDLAGFETWAAIVDGRLAASLIAFFDQECCSILYQQSCTETLSLGVNNALTFAFTNEILARSPKHWIFYGLQSLDAPPSVDEFKFRMGYTAKAVRQRVVFHPWLRPAFNGLLHGALVSLRKRMPGNPTLAKTEGMLRFYRQGRLPLDQQDMPPPLREARSAA